MKVGSKRRRTKQQIEDDKVAALVKAEAIEEKLKMLDQVIKENAEIKANQEQQKSEAENVVSHLIDQGLIHKDNNGTWGPGPNAGQTLGQ